MPLKFDVEFIARHVYMSNAYVLCCSVSSDTRVDSTTRGSSEQNLFHFKLAYTETSISKNQYHIFAMVIYSLLSLEFSPGFALFELRTLCYAINHAIQTILTATKYILVSVCVLFMHATNCWARHEKWAFLRRKQLIIFFRNCIKSDSVFNFEHMLRSS